MSFDFPAQVERDIRRYAEAHRLSPDEAATRLIQDALKAEEEGITDEDLAKLREMDPAVDFFAGLSDSVIDHIEKAYYESRAEMLTPRG